MPNDCDLARARLANEPNYWRTEVKGKELNPKSRRQVDSSRFYSIGYNYIYKGTEEAEEEEKRKLAEN